MIDLRCRACHHWQPPPHPNQKQGRCGRDHALAHPGYTCKQFQYSANTLLAIFKISPGELAWLQVNPDDPLTTELRARFVVARHAAPNDDSWQVTQSLLAEWRRMALCA